MDSLVPRTRNIVLVGHNVVIDLKILQLLHFDRHTSIVGILDTGKIVSTILTLPNISHRLSSILSKLGSPYQNLHVAGNDAYFTFRVFLLLAIRSYTDKMVDSRHQKVLAVLKAITDVSIQTAGSSDKEYQEEAEEISEKSKISIEVVGHRRTGANSSRTSNTESRERE